MTHVCTKCGRRLPLYDFVRDSSAALGIKYVCRACYRDLRKTYPSYPKRKGEP
jgi:ribosomal protein L40E